MKKNETQPGLANNTARPAHSQTTPIEINGVQLNDDGSAILPTFADADEPILRAAERCGGAMAKMAHEIRCLRAARGGTSNISQTANKHLAHHDLKSVTLERAQEIILRSLARAEAKAVALLPKTLDAILDVEINRADLLRCEDAKKRKKESGFVWEEYKVLECARSIIGRLARQGIQEGHWSTATRQTVDRMAEMLRADNLAAGVGSPDNPRLDWKKDAK